jgi:hypothetical protein
MPSGRMPEGPAALSNAERQARHRAKMQMLALRAPLPAKRPKAAARRSWSQRWNDALAELLAVRPNAPRGSRRCPKACAKVPPLMRFKR